jgi:hypothetical protein
MALELVSDCHMLALFTSVLAGRREATSFERQSVGLSTSLEGRRSVFASCAATCVCLPGISPISHGAAIVSCCLPWTQHCCCGQTRTEVFFAHRFRAVNYVHITAADCTLTSTSKTPFAVVPKTGFVRLGSTL